MKQQLSEYIHISDTGGLTSGGVVLRTKLVDGEVSDLIPGRACRPRLSEFSLVTSETRINTG